jgi:hypothetical protein
MPSRIIQVAAQLGVSVSPTDSPETIVAKTQGIPLRALLDKLYRGELQKLCEHRGADRSGAVYDQDLVERLLKGA